MYLYPFTIVHIAYINYYEFSIYAYTYTYIHSNFHTELRILIVLNLYYVKDSYIQ